jgi:hypothetical protein
MVLKEATYRQEILQENLDHLIAGQVAVGQAKHADIRGDYGADLQRLPLDGLVFREDNPAPPPDFRKPNRVLCIIGKIVIMCFYM